MRKFDQRGRRTSIHGTYLPRALLETDAWRALSPKAQMAYIWLRLEWKGKRFNNNGKMQLSYRQAGRCIGISKDTAMVAFHELQKKGFIVVTELGALGIEGEGKGPRYELTDLEMPKSLPSQKYLGWSKGNDFVVERHPSNNPSGRRGN